MADDDGHLPDRDADGRRHVHDLRGIRAGGRRDAGQRPDHADRCQRAGAAVRRPITSASWLSSRLTGLDLTFERQVRTVTARGARAGRSGREGPRRTTRATLPERDRRGRRSLREVEEVTWVPMVERPGRIDRPLRVEPAGGPGLPRSSCGTRRLRDDHGRRGGPQCPRRERTGAVPAHRRRPIPPRRSRSW